MESASSPVDQSHQHQHQHNEQLLAYERKWVEELESFKKLAVRLQQQAEPQQHALQTGELRLESAVLLQCFGNSH